MHSVFLSQHHNGARIDALQVSPHSPTRWLVADSRHRISVWEWTGHLQLNCLSMMQLEAHFQPQVKADGGFSSDLQQQHGELVSIHFCGSVKKSDNVRKVEESVEIVGKRRIKLAFVLSLQDMTMEFGPSTFARWVPLQPELIAVSAAVASPLRLLFVDFTRQQCVRSVPLSHSCSTMEFAPNGPILAVGSHGTS